MESSRVVPKYGGGKEKTKMTSEQKESDFSLVKHYPWLKSFDDEIRTFVRAPEVDLSLLLKLVTMLESHVSSEVSKLKTRPNRATKLLTQIRKKISVMNTAGLIFAPDTFKLLFPTYGLLMTHFVNISLVSSKVNRQGAQSVAVELYNLLRIIFENDNEYILDIVLCSTLDEHAGSKEKVGFHLFSHILQDWLFYSNSDSAQMKYCAICSLLVESCKAGKRTVEENLPSRQVDESFVQFLGHTLNDEFRKEHKKIRLLKDVVKHIKTTSVKSKSRSRLVVVSKRDISNTDNRDRSESSDSSLSTVVGARNREIPSSSGYAFDDPMHKILDDLGLGGGSLGFFLDTNGQEDDPSNDYYDGSLTNYAANQNDQVSSSSPQRRISQSSIAETVNIQSRKGQKEKDQEMDLDDDSDEKETLSKSRKRYTYSSPERDYVATVSRTPSPPPDDDGSNDERDDSIGSWKSKDSQMSGDEENNASFETRDKEQKKKAGSITKRDESSKTGQGAMANQKTDDKEEDADSDLEVVSVIDTKEVDADCDRELMSGESSSERDEAEAESGEDVVPNYDEDSDENLQVASTPTDGDCESENIKQAEADSMAASCTDDAAEKPDCQENLGSSVSTSTDGIETQSIICDDKIENAVNEKQGADSKDDERKSEASTDSVTTEKVNSPVKGRKVDLPSPPTTRKRRRANELKNSESSETELTQSPEKNIEQETPKTPAGRGRGGRRRGTTTRSAATPPPSSCPRRSSRLNK